jgi:hypothetical protein
VDVLGDALVRIEAMNCACQQQYAGEIRTQGSRHRATATVKAEQKWSARSHLRTFAIKHVRNGGRKLDDSAVSVRQVRIVDGWNCLNKTRKIDQKAPRTFGACALKQRSAEPARVRSAHECAMLWNATDPQCNGGAGDRDACLFQEDTCRRQCDRAVN